ncbi:MAG: archaemetzincin family Zn-dependent metalloprotease [Bryobacteraceae bacterium]|nr:archaemetzincin family Zn-dependent metalloprotease [Bryobacterales bacterium]MEB2362125.1 archaemetzincin family Zn-dependent metalloprotease [Bryobacterales bacterium]NUN02622.1 archaemetzincin family Zn-dependent metalloprotease [Bryobacteraceae bacterium]
MHVIPIGRVEPRVIETAQRCLADALGCNTVLVPAMEDFEFAYDSAREQYSAPQLLQRLARHRLANSWRLLAITELDLFIPMLSYVYGQAQLGGALAIVSIARLRQEFHGFPADEGLLMVRTAKEVLHETGHTLGLVHCRDETCVMSLSTNIRQVDVKRPAFCVDCRVRAVDAAGGHRRQEILEAGVSE